MKLLKIFFALLIIANFAAKMALGQLRVTSAIPDGPIPSLEQSQEIVVTFSEPVIKLSQVKNLNEGPLQIFPQVAGAVRWLGTSSFAFKPLKPLPYATRFRCLIPASTRSVSGERLEHDYIWTFTTPRPRLLSHIPRNGQKFVDLQEKIWLYFNQPVDQKSAQKVIRVSTVAGKTVPINIRYPTQEELEQFKPRRGIRQRFRQQAIAEQDSTRWRQRNLILEPLKSWPVGETMTVHIRPGLTGRDGPLPMAKKAQFSFRTREVFRFLSLENSENISPTAALKFRFSNPVKYSDFVQSLQLNPPVEIPQGYKTWSFPNQTIVISFALLPDTTYTFAIAKTLKDQFGNPLGRAIHGKFTTGDYPPKLHLPVGFAILENEFSPQIPIEVLNLANLHLSLARLSPDDLVSLAGSEERYALFARRNPFPISFAMDTLWNPEITKNKKYRLPFSLKKALGARASGIVAVQASSQSLQENELSYYKAIIQITPMGITGKFSPTENLIFVTRLKDATPVPGARVELRTTKNRVVWSGQTGGNGSVITPGWAELGLKAKNNWQEPRIWVFVYKDSSIAFCRSDWDAGISPWRFNISYNWNPQPTLLKANLQTDRGLYRTRETVYFKGIVRQKDGRGKWHIPFSPMLQLLIQDSRGEEIFKKKISLNDFGAFDDSLHLSETAPLGPYWLNLSWKKEPGPKARWESIVAKSFRVEAFRPAAFKAKVLPVSPPIGKDEYIFGDSLYVRISGRYLFGAPMQRVPVSWRLQLHPYTFSYPQWKRYVFSARPSPEGTSGLQTRLLASGLDTLDSDGMADIRAFLASPSATSGARLLIEATVTGPSRQQISGRTAVRIHRGEFEMGVRLDRYLFQAKKTVQCSVIVVSPMGKPLSGRELKAKVYQIQWNSVRKAGVGGRYHWISERIATVVDSAKILSKSTPVVYPFTPKKAGYYVVEFEGQDQRGHRIVASRDFYASGAGYVAWARSDDDLIRLLPDAEKYAPGDTARLLVQSPYQSARALVTIERESVLASFVQQIEGSAATLAIPVRQNYLPNVFVSVVLLQGRTAKNKYSEAGYDLGRPQFKMGYAMLKVSPGSRRLRVSVTADRKEYRPGERVTVDLAAVKSNNKPALVEFTIAVVDAGVLNLIGYQLQDPFGTFYGSRPLSVRTGETLVHLIEQRSYGEKGEPPGGGGGEGFAGFDMRSRFSALAYWNPALRSDAQGRARITFALPDNLTTFRIMVIAHTRSSEFGAAMTDITVNKPLILLPSSPRFARIGDQFMAGVVVTNNTSFPGLVRVGINAKGIHLEGKSTSRDSLQPGQSKEFLFRFAAANSGQAEFEFRAELRLRDRQVNDGLTWSIPISFPQNYETVATFGNTEQAAQEMLVIPKKIFPDSGYVEISVASTALVGLRQSVQYLFAYPYGCLEQRLSRILPIILSEELVHAFGLKILAEENDQRVVQKALQDISTYQQPDGGFALWKDGSVSYPYISSYALWALAAATNHGYTVPKRMLQNLIRYAQNLLRMKYQPQRWQWGGEQVYLASRALAYYALGLAGRPDANYGEVLFQERQKMPIFARAFLLRGLAANHAAHSLQVTLAGELLNLAQIEARTAYFAEPNESGLWWSWSSTTRTTAVVLQALLESDTDFPQADRVVRWLLQRRKNGRWRTTQENLYALHALTSYLQKYETEAPDFAAEVKLAGKRILDEKFSGRSERVVSKKLSLQTLERGKALPVAIEKAGRGRIYYGLSMRYFPRHPAPPADQGLSIKKEMEVIQGKQLAAKTFAAGSLIKITLTLSTPQERHFVVIDDPLPAGFEAVNLRFQTESRELTQQMRATQYPGSGFLFNHVEMQDDRVLAFADYLPAGVHVYTYLVRATGMGSFAAPAPYGEEMYAPEVFGKGETGQIVVKEK